MTTGANSTAAYLQGNNDRLTNSGIIHATGSTSSAVFSNTASSGFTAQIENKFGGQIISDQAEAIRTLNGNTVITNAGLLQGGAGTAINGGGGPVSLILQTGSTLIGLANGGGNANKVTLEGSGEITNAFANFQTLFMQGSDWLWQGTATFNDSYIQKGTFRLQNSITGNMTISSGTSLLAGNDAHPSITPNVGGPEITVINAGLIDLTNGTGAGTNSLTIEGNYTGDNGVARLHTVLAADNAPSDKLILSTGAATGLTSLDIINLGGTGELTTQDGIMVVQAINGAVTNNAFKLSNSLPVGAYEYFLFKGGATFGAYWTYLNPQNAYLDAVIMDNWFNGRAKSTRNIGIDIDNTSFITSLEGG